MVSGLSPGPSVEIRPDALPRTGTHTGTETAHRAVSLAARVPFRISTAE